MSTVLAGNAVTNLDALAVAGNMSVAGALQLASTPSITAAQSCVWLNTANGYGSTSTMIKRYTTAVVNQGSDITYADSATLGATFTINTSGVYAMSIISSSALTATPGISLNSAQLTTVVASITAATRACVNTAVAAAYATASATMYLAAGTVVRPHTDGAASNNAGLEQFQIVRVA